MNILVSMREGTVILPFLNKKAAFTALSRIVDTYRNWLWREGELETFGLSIHPELVRPDLNPRTYEAREEWHLISRGSSQKINPVFLAVPIKGRIAETAFRYSQFAKIPGMTPMAVVMSLQSQGVGLADLEEPFASLYGWPPYKKGSLIPLAALSRKT